MSIRIFMVTGSYVSVPDLTLTGYENSVRQIESREGKTLRVVDGKNFVWSLRVDKISHAIEDKD